MALTPCKECGTEISTTAKACPKCGAKPKKPNPQLRAFLILIGIVLAVALLMPTSPEEKQKRLERSAIEECWKEHARKSLAPPEQRFIASTCEIMEKKFREKYGRNP